ncbi:MAG: 2-hydroxychromene-2-carboxylate isomerase, partial [Burkholderiales bacterium]|nr:2-hydroxychromene-2-carboxylate isomerase [Burkholderiales bacterium]
ATGASVNVLPVDYKKIFPATGGLPLKQRAPERQAYRLVELQRWRDYLGIPLNLEPKYFPADDRAAALMIIAARQRGDDALTFSHGLLRAVWAEERDIADKDTLIAIANEAGLDGNTLIRVSADTELAAVWERDTETAIKRGVFGAPSYVVDGEIFWGQDRLDFLERKLRALT